MSPPDLLNLSDVTVTFGGGIGKKPPFVALEGFDLAIPSDRAEIIAVAGESGSGKTTLGRVILGMTKPDSGSVTFAGDDIWKTRLVHSKGYLRNVQAVFQDPFSVFNPFYPVEHLLRMPLKMFRIARSRAEQDTRITEALRQVGLRPDQVIGRYPHQLSGGQRQRIVVARALMLRPKLIVADEPVSMIDASLRANVLENLKALRDQHGISILYITHDLATARQVSDRLYVLYRGRAVETGTAADVIGLPKHPYTQLLMSSIPRPDPNTPWPAEAMPKSEIGRGDRTACVFIDRCPSRMPQCALQPRAFALENGRSVACHLYAPAPSTAVA
ncbi:MAG TPA: ABC transporter ATP-binding protein [Kaistia sp.]|nr:ABC transporter ATP-binding protein [Kaistia sp.]